MGNAAGRPWPREDAREEASQRMAKSRCYRASKVGMCDQIRIFCASTVLYDIVRYCTVWYGAVLYKYGTRILQNWLCNGGHIDHVRALLRLLPLSLTVLTMHLKECIFFQITPDPNLEPLGKTTHHQGLSAVSQLSPRGGGPAAQPTRTQNSISQPGPQLPTSIFRTLEYSR